MTRLWRITGQTLQEVQPAKLQSEAAIETWIADDPSILGLDVVIIGRQVETAHGGRIDLLALDREGAVWIIECKRDRTPREVIAQVLDYASWVRLLTDRDLDEIARQHRGKSLAAVFQDWAKTSLPESLNTSHNMVVVATAFDEASKRIVEYLADEHGVSINAAFFRVFDDGGQAFLASDWLLEVERVVERHREKVRVPWTGHWFTNVASTPFRSWEDCRTHGFISASGAWAEEYRNIQRGQPIYAYIKGKGYVGFGIVASDQPQPISDLVLADGTRLVEKTLLQPAVLTTEPSELGLAISWQKAVPEKDALWFAGAFANQHVACRLRQPQTLAFLAEKLGAAPQSAAINA
jgi:hypothetical protein